MLFVYPNEVAGYEVFMSNLYESYGLDDMGSWKYPNSSTIGIVSVDENGLFHDTEKSALSDYDFLLPVSYFRFGTTTRKNSILFNIHNEPLRVTAIDAAVTCNLQNLNTTTECTYISDFLVPKLDYRIAPAAYLVYPARIGNKLTGLFFT